MNEWKKCRKKPITVEFRKPLSRQELIHTKEGDLLAYKGKDYVIRGIEGEIYPIDKKIFKKIYEVVE